MGINSIKLWLVILAFSCSASYLASKSFRHDIREASYAAAYRLWEHHTDNGFRTLVQASTGIFERESDNDQVSMCTLTVFDKTATGYRILTAGHCVEENPTKKAYAFLPDGSAYPLNLEFYGHATDDDFAVYSFESKQDKEYVPLGDASKLRPGDDVMYAGYPGIWGQELLIGTIARVKPLPEWRKSIWNDHIAASIAGGPGASGSGLVSLKQRAIVAVLSGYRQNQTGIVWFYPVPIIHAESGLIFSIAGHRFKIAFRSRNEIKIGPLVYRPPVITLTVTRVAPEPKKK